MGVFSHSWNGTVLTITSDSGTSSCDLKGEKGDDGVRGAQGAGIITDEEIEEVIDLYVTKNNIGVVDIDTTLSIEGQAADAKATGDSIALINNAVELIENDIAVIDNNIKDINESIGNIDIDTSIIIDLIYPVGSIYMGVNAVNPSTFLVGTTWEVWGSGRVPVGVNTDDTSFATVEKTGGSKELQTHAHSFTPQGTISSTTATGTISSTAATGTISSVTPTMQSSGAHAHDVYAKFNKDGGTGGTRPSFIQNGANDQKSMAIYVPSSGAHTHTMNAHNHTFTGTAHSHTFTGTAHNHAFTGTAGNTGATGTGDSGNLQPYITCYMWKRVA